MKKRLRPVPVVETAEDAAPEGSADAETASCGEEGGEGKADESGPGGLENAVEEEVFTLKVTASKVRKSC